MTRAYSNFSTLPPPLVDADERAVLALSEQANGAVPSNLAADGGSEPGEWRITETQKQLALEVFRGGGSVGDAAREAGMAWSTARLLLAAEISRLGRRMPMWHAMTEIEINHAVQLRAAGWSYKRIADRFGVSKPTVVKHLKRRHAAG